MTREVEDMLDDQKWEYEQRIAKLEQSNETLGEENARLLRQAVLDNERIAKLERERDARLAIIEEMDEVAHDYDLMRDYIGRLREAGGE